MKMHPQFMFNVSKPHIGMYVSREVVIQSNQCSLVPCYPSRYYSR